MTDQQNDFQAGQAPVSTCPNCGMPIAAQNAFCQSCGAPLTPFAQQQRQQQEAAWAQQRQQQQQQQWQQAQAGAQQAQQATQAGAQQQAWQQSQPGQQAAYGQQPNAQQPYGQQSNAQQQPYAQSGFSQPPVDSKSKIAAGLLGIFLGSLGIHKFYLGYSGAGVAMLLVTVLATVPTFGIAAGVMSVIGLIEGIIYLTKTDEQFYCTYVAAKRSWF